VRVNSLAPSYCAQRPLQRPLEAAVRAKDCRQGLPPSLFVLGFGFSSLGFFHRPRARALLRAFAAHRVARAAAAALEAATGARAEAAEAELADAFIETQWLPDLSSAAHLGSYGRLALLRVGGFSGTAQLQSLSDLPYRADGSLWLPTSPPPRRPPAAAACCRCCRPH
jgi:hypothetical protein